MKKLSEKIREDGWSATNEECADDARALEVDNAALLRQRDYFADYSKGLEERLRTAEAKLARVRDKAEIEGSRPENDICDYVFHSIIRIIDGTEGDK